MTREEFFKANDDTFLPLGFRKISEDPMFFYEYPLCDPDDNEHDSDELPALVFGDSGINQGFCIYIPETSNFIWIGVLDPKEAVEWAKKITNFEF